MSIIKKTLLALPLALTAFGLTTYSAPNPKEIARTAVHGYAEYEDPKERLRPGGVYKNCDITFIDEGNDKRIDSYSMRCTFGSESGSISYAPAPLHNIASRIALDFDIQEANKENVKLSLTKGIIKGAE